MDGPVIFLESFLKVDIVLVCDTQMRHTNVDSPRKDKKNCRHFMVYSDINPFRSGNSLQCRIELNTADHLVLHGSLQIMRQTIQNPFLVLRVVSWEHTNVCLNDVFKNHKNIFGIGFSLDKISWRISYVRRVTQYSVVDDDLNMLHSEQGVINTYSLSHRNSEDIASKVLRYLELLLAELWTWIRVDMKIDITINGIKRLNA